MEGNNQMAENISGGETAATEAPAVDNQTIEDGFLAGFSSDESVDGQSEQESDSKEELGGDSKKSDSDKTEEKSDSDQKQRPDKRSRSSERIHQILAEKREVEARLAQFQKLYSENNKPKLKLDEDGNATVEDLAKYNEELISQKMEQQQRENENRIKMIERERDLEKSIASVQSGVAERMSKYSILDPNSKDYVPDLSDAISKSALDRLQQLQVSGVDDFIVLADDVLEHIDREIRLAEIAQKNSQARIAQNYHRMQNGGAIVSGNQGRSLVTNDDFLSGLNE